PRFGPRRTKTQQDQLGGPPAPWAERPPRHRRGEPQPAREQGEGAQATAAGALSEAARGNAAARRKVVGDRGGANRRRTHGRRPQGRALLARHRSCSRHDGSDASARERCRGAPGDNDGKSHWLSADRTESLGRSEPLAPTLRPKTAKVVDSLREST